LSQVTASIAAVTLSCSIMFKVCQVRSLFCSRTRILKVTKQ